MSPELYRNIKYTAAALLILLLSGAGCKVEPQCDNGPSGAVRMLAGQNASITLDRTVDNCTFSLTMETPDPYLHWTSGSDSGNHSRSCFMDYWDNHYSDEERSALIWIGSTDPVCGIISSVKYAGGVITAVLKRPFNTSASLAGSGAVVIEINRSCPTADPCVGKTDLSGNCYQPFMSFDATGTSINVSGADLNTASFDGAVLPGSDFTGASLSHASFVNSDLRDVNFDGALLLDTNLEGAFMSGVTMGNAFIYQTTAPNGTMVDTVSQLLNNLIEE